MSLWVAVDGGQSALRVRASWHDSVATAPGYRSSTSPQELAVDLVEAVAGRNPPAAVERIVVGHTGMPPDAPGRSTIADRFRQAGLDAELVLAPDWVTAHAGALNGRPGVVTVAGSGCVALGIAADGQWVRVDGRGHLLGDRGSAYALGRGGLAEALRQWDDGGPDATSPLIAAARAYLGDDLELGAWRLHADAGRVNRIAAFAQRVLACAEQGDMRARELVSETVGELVRTTLTACRRLPGEPGAIGWSGGLFGNATLIGDPYRRELAERAPEWRLVESSPDPLAGAVRLARTGASGYAPLCTIVARNGR